MDNRYTFGVGVGYEADGTPILDAEARKVVALSTMAKMFGGYACQDINGGWIDPRGVLVTEPGLTITVVTPATIEQAEIAAAMLKKTFNQEQILLTVERLESIRYL